MNTPRLLALLAGLAVSACDDAGRDVDRVRREVEEATQAVAREAAGQRDGAQRAIDEKLADLDRRLTRAREAMRGARHAKADAERRLRELEDEGRRLRQRAEEARRAGSRAWTDIERSLDRALSEMEAAWNAPDTHATPIQEKR